MIYLIITHVEHAMQNNQYFAYAPYVQEMNIWLKHVDQVEIVAPISNYEISKIDMDYNHSNINFNKIPDIEFTSISKSFYSIIKIPKILKLIFKACQKADHIHLRCPGNIGLLGCFVQIFFPRKIKTAKYAGNWDPKSKQPVSYNIQKFILKNTFLTKNMQTLVYGQWENQTKNIKPFFTASYSDFEIHPILKRNYIIPLKFVFVGKLVPGKRPLMTIKILESLIKSGIESQLNIYGEGVLKKTLLAYIIENKLESSVRLHGNVDKESLKLVLKKSDFLILPSKSEGWPKAVAEAMFFGVIPITTNISCLGWMLDHGRRGMLISDDLKEAVNKITNSIQNDNLLAMSVASQQWSQKYTLEKFESEIKMLLIKV
jgi:glycosyltransferase involved in cell wall biosynthesis